MAILIQRWFWNVLIEKVLMTTVSRLDGIFAMAVYDLLNDTVTLIRDNAGVKASVLWALREWTGIFFKLQPYNIS